MSDKNALALKLAEEVLKELESSKGKLVVAIQKMLHVAKLIDDQDIAVWCKIQLGDSTYTRPLFNYVQAWVGNQKKSSEVTKKALKGASDVLEKLKLVFESHYDNESLTFLVTESSGGTQGIGFIEEKYADLVKTRRGNDNTYYKNNLNQRINYVRKLTHAKAVTLHSKLAFSGFAISAFDVIKETVEDRLLDLDPELAEQLILAFKGVNGAKPEEWSQALTSVRRFLQRLADKLYPSSETPKNGRALGAENYINRLWAFMDEKIKSVTNRELAKAHVDFLGSLLQNTYKASNKGVHANLDRIEAIRSVFHLYLSCSHLLEFLNSSVENSFSVRKSIQTATLDEIESVLGVKRTLAKEIVKSRIVNGPLTPEKLAELPGIGPKILTKAKELFEWN